MSIKFYGIGNQVLLPVAEVVGKLYVSDENKDVGLIVGVKRNPSRFEVLIKGHKIEKHTYSYNSFVVDTSIKTTIEGKHFCFTGPAHLKRDTLKNITELCGGIAQSSVTSKTDYLVMASLNSNSTKAQKAREQGVTLISEKEFMRMASTPISS